MLSRARQAATVAAGVVRGSLLDRVGCFFLLILPLLVILVVGVVTESLRYLPAGVASADGTTPAALTATLDQERRVDARTYDSPAALRRAVAEGRVAIGVVVDRSEAYRSVELVRASGSAGEHLARTIVWNAVLRHRGGGLGPPPAVGTGGEPTVSVVTPEGAPAVPPFGYHFAAAGEVVFLMFTGAVTLAGSLVSQRRRGIERRILAAPVALLTYAVGDVAGRILTAAVQGIVVVVAAAVLFGVRWGDPAAMALLIVAWSMVCAAAGQLVGAMAQTRQQVHAVAPALGIAIGLVAGCVVPLPDVSGPLAAIARVLPHRWLLDAVLRVGEDDAWPTTLRTTTGLVAVAAVVGAISVTALARTVRRP